MTSTHAPGTAVAHRRHAPIPPVAAATGRPRATSHRLFRVAAWLSAAAGLGFGLTAFAYEPLITGAIGITLGSAGKHAGSRLGRLAVAVAMLGTIVGPVVGSTVYAVLTAS